MKTYNSITIRATQAEADAGLLTGLPVGITVIMPNNEVRVVDQSGNPQAVQTAGNSPLNNFAATTAPTTANNFVAGFSVGSRWIDITNDESYICTGDGEWSKTTVGIISEVAGLQAALDLKATQTALNAKPNIDDASNTATANAWSVSKTKTYVDGKVAQTTTYQTFNDADSPASATLDTTNQDAVGQPTLSAVAAVVTGSAFVSNIAETHLSTKWIINAVIGSADTVNKTSRTLAANEVPSGTDLGEAIAIRAAYIDSNNNQSRRAVAVNASIASVDMASTWTDTAYPIATGSTFKFNHAQLDLFAINVKAGFFVEAKLQGGSQPTETALALIANTLNIGVANQVQFWAGFFDGTFTKALKIQLTNDGAGNMTVNVLEGAHWNGNVLASASWTTSGGEPTGKNPQGNQGVAGSSGGAGYGLNNLTVRFQV